MTKPVGLRQHGLSYVYFPYTTSMYLGYAVAGDPEQQPYLNSKHALFKIFGLVLGINTLFVTYYIHFDSPWYKEGLWLNCSMIELLRGDTQLEWVAYGLHFRMKIDHCPGITMERFLLGTNFVIIAISSVCFVCCCWANLDTVNAVRTRESFYYVSSGIILLIGGILFAVSSGKISKNKCETKLIKEEMFHQSNLCDKYFLSHNKYVAVILGMIQGVYFITLACLLDNVKLFGMKNGSFPRRRNQASTDADIENDSGSGQINGSRKSVARSMGKRRSSLARKGKGIGSFGAVTSNMTNNTSGKLQKTNSLPDTNRKMRKSMMPRSREKIEPVDKTTSSGMIHD